MKCKLVTTLVIMVGLFGLMGAGISVNAQAKDAAGTTVTPTIPNSEETTTDTDVPLDENNKPSGGGSVVESNNTSGEGKTFYTITTKDEQVFYIIVDNSKASDNVYLLTDVTQADLTQMVAENESPILKETPKAETNGTTSNTETEATPKKEPEEATTNYLPFILLIGLVAGAIGGAYYYFKVYKPKQDLDDAEDLEDFSFVDEVENYRNDQYATDELEVTDEEDDE
ncbi:TPA_asm: DUF4366 domain-containing protein [Listeria monocytogenes]|nr:DUF4366 domain-containing protein [Listeria monocytogenes]